jgi:hypothetical protein
VNHRGDSKRTRSTEDDSDYLGSPTRRGLMRAGAGSLAALAAGGLFAGRVAEAKPIDSPAGVPVVDRLAVRVVTDSYHHAFEPGRTLGALQVQRLGFAVAPRQAPRRTLQNEWDCRCTWSPRAVPRRATCSSTSATRRRRC